MFCFRLHVYDHRSFINDKSLLNIGDNHYKSLTCRPTNYDFNPRTRRLSLSVETFGVLEIINLPSSHLPRKWASPTYYPLSFSSVSLSVQHQPFSGASALALVLSLQPAPALPPTISPFTISWPRLVSAPPSLPPASSFLPWLPLPTPVVYPFLQFVAMPPLKSSRLPKLVTTPRCSTRLVLCKWITRVWRACRLRPVGQCRRSLSQSRSRWTVNTRSSL